MSALTTNTSNQFREKRKRRETTEKVIQVIKGQTKVITKSLEIERKKSRSPKERATAHTTKIKCSKIVDSSR
jgi:hypothetical protein